MNYNNNFENNSIGNDDGKNVYRATANMNTAIETPDVDIDSIMGVNIERNSSESGVNVGQASETLLDDNVILDYPSGESNVDSFSTIENSDNYDRNMFVPQDVSDLSNDELINDNLNASLDNNKTVYVVPMDKKKKPNDGLKELKFMFLIVALLLILIFIFPYI